MMMSEELKKSEKKNLLNHQHKIKCLKTLKEINIYNINKMVIQEKTIICEFCKNEVSPKILEAFHFLDKKFCAKCINKSAKEGTGIYKKDKDGKKIFIPFFNKNKIMSNNNKSEMNNFKKFHLINDKNNNGCSLKKPSDQWSMKQDSSRQSKWTTTKKVKSNGAGVGIP